MQKFHCVIPINLITETLFCTGTLASIGLPEIKKYSNAARLGLKEHPTARCKIDLGRVIQSSSRALFGTSYRRANRIGTSSIENERRQTYRISKPTNAITKSRFIRHGSPYCLRSLSLVTNREAYNQRPYRQPRQKPNTIWLLG